MMPAQAVPWPTRSSCGPSTYLVPVSPSGSASTATYPATPPTAGWSPSTPESTIATLTPLPVASAEGPFPCGRRAAGAR